MSSGGAFPSVRDGALTTTGGPSSHDRSSLPPGSFLTQQRQEQSPTPALVGDPVASPGTAAGSRTDPEPINSVQTGPQPRRQVPELSMSFTGPNTHPKPTHQEGPSQAP